MKLYFAPLEGITLPIYRNTHNEFFGHCDEYFAPFVTPTDNEKLGEKNIRGILPEANEVKLRVQCMANSEFAVCDFSHKVKELGYDDLNINLGCPSQTVVKKGKGSGALKDLNRLCEFLDYIFKNSKTKISLKTRTGFSSHEEFDKLLEVYKTFPVSELVVHPRIRDEFYKGAPTMADFDLAYRTLNVPLCYNGDIWDVKSFDEINENYPQLSAVMIGRGAIKNPAIFREIKGGKALTTEELVRFSKELEKRYFALFQSPVYTLQKMKEVWNYSILNYPDCEKIAKVMKKAKNLDEFNNAVNCLPEIKSQS